MNMRSVGAVGSSMIFIAIGYTADNTPAKHKSEKATKTSSAVAANISSAVPITFAGLAASRCRTAKSRCS